MIQLRFSTVGTMSLSIPFLAASTTSAASPTGVCITSKRLKSRSPRLATTRLHQLLREGIHQPQASTLHQLPTQVAWYTLVLHHPSLSTNALGSSWFLLHAFWLFTSSHFRRSIPRFLSKIVVQEFPTVSPTSLSLILLFTCLVAKQESLPNWPVDSRTLTLAITVVLQYWFSEAAFLNGAIVIERK